MLKRLLLRAAGMAAVMAAAAPMAKSAAPAPDAAAPRVTCAAGAAAEMPPAMTAAARTAEMHPALCSVGQVPQPLGRIAPKGMPAISRHGIGGVAAEPQNELFFFYNAAFQYQNVRVAEGRFSQSRPVVGPADYHSLAELAGESADGLNIVEVGWTVDPGLNGDALPHLFVFHWIDGRPTCYNGCGYVQVSQTRFPGMPVSPTRQPQLYAIRFYAHKWWVGYQGEWIGYFPEALWQGNFTELGFTQWFGEVAAGSQTPCTQMGDGLFGGTDGAAAIRAEHFGTGPAAASQGAQTNPAFYAIGGFTGTGYQFGGPGGC